MINRYFIGVFFLLLSMLTSCFNDIICKFMGQRLDAIEIIFFRFFFGLVTLFPFLSKKHLHTAQLGINITRGVFGAVSFLLCTYSVIKLPLAEVTAILWIIPVFQLVLASLFLSEEISLRRWIATVFGFVGLGFITLHYSAENLTLSMLYIIPVSAALLFALQDIIIKKAVVTESSITMLFYFALVASAVSFVPTLFVWKTPTMYEFAMLLLLGIGGNLIQYFIFRAFDATDLSALAPYRYIEFLLSAGFAFLFFGEIPGKNVIVGAVILIPSTLYLAYSEKKNNSLPAEVS